MDGETAIPSLFFISNVIGLSLILLIYPQAVPFSQIYFILLAVPLMSFAFKSAGIETVFRFKGFSEDPVPKLAIGFGIGAVMAAPYIIRYLSVTPPETIFVWFFALAVAPFVEEAFFRGTLQEMLEEVIGVAAIPVQGILFGIYHYFAYEYSVPALVYTSLAGIVLGLLAYMFDSIDASIAAHTIYNFLSLLATTGVV